MKLILIVIFCFISMLFYAQSTETFTCYFDHDKATLSAAETARFTQWFADSKTQECVLISAYTDTIGSDAYNQKLAERRLAFVLDKIKPFQPTCSTKVVGENYALKDYRNHADYRKVVITYKPVIVQKVVEHVPELVTIDEEPIDQLKRQRFSDFESIGLDKTINLNIQFQNNSAIYYDWSSAEQVYVLAEFLKEHSNYTAFLKGHVCCSNSMAMSSARAFRVYQDLIRLGINKDRLSYEGFSNTLPLVTEVSDEAKQMNRRVEVVFSIR